MKNTPQLQFVYDDTAERGMRITSCSTRKTSVMGGSNGSRSSRDEVLQAIREHERFCLTTHERPDGDAVGSLAAMQQVLAALGKDAVAFMPAEEFPLPYEYRFIQLEGLVTEPPADLCERTLIFLDCGNIDRTPVEQRARRRRADRQHRPPPRQHALRDDQPRRPARLVHGGDGVGPRCTGSAWSPRQPIAEALYVGLVTDTGRFMYENTGPRAHEMAAELIAGGLDAHAIYRHLYEGIPQGKLSCSRAG